MTNSISELWYGNLDPAQNFGRGNKEIKELEKLLLYNQERLESSLNENSQELLDRLVECMNEYVCESCHQAFCDGYCVGVKMIADALYGADKVLL